MSARQVIAQFSRFVSVGVFGAIAHFAILIGSVELLGASPVAGAVCGAAAGALVQYTFGRRFVFNAQRTHVAAVPRFLATAAANMGLNGLGMALLEGVMGVPYILAQVLVSGVLFIANYLISRRWVFRDRSVF